MRVQRSRRPVSWKRTRYPSSQGRLRQPLLRQPLLRQPLLKQTLLKQQLQLAWTKRWPSSGDPWRRLNVSPILRQPP